VLDQEWVLANATENQDDIDDLSLSPDLHFSFGLQIVIYQLSSIFSK